MNRSAGRVYRSSNRKRHWSERSWWNPRRWLAAPLIVGAAGAVAQLVGTGLLMAGGDLLVCGTVALGGALLTVGAIAWAQSDLNFLKTKLDRERQLDARN